MITRRNLGCAAAAWAVALALSGCGKPTHTQRPIDQQRVTQIRNEISEGAGGSGGGPARPDPTGFATLRGTFKFAAADAGQFTSRPALPLSGGDAGFCSQGGAPKSNSLLVKPTGEVQNVVVYLGDDLSKMENQEAWIHPSAAPGNEEPVEFDQDNCVFLTPVLTMQVSQPLIILNSDGVAHNTKPVAGVIPPGGRDTFQHKKESRTPYPVTCNIHPWMTAHIMARNNGYFAQTNENGEFTIENLPAGVDLNIKVWHEKAGGFITSVTVNGEKTTWSKKGFTINLPPDEEVNLDVVLDPAQFSN